MTEDTSPENLRKFLESDDPALVRMGLSMAKGSGVPEELHLTLLGILLWDSEEGNREAAKDLIDGIGIKNIPEFRGWLESLDMTAVCSRLVIAEALGKIGGVRAVELLIGAMEHSNENVCKTAKKALIKIGKPAVEPLIKIIEYDYIYSYEKKNVVYALGKIGDARAVEPLIKWYQHNWRNKDRWECLEATRNVLRKLGHESKIEKLDKVIKEHNAEMTRRLAK